MKTTSLETSKLLKEEEFPQPQDREHYFWSCDSFNEKSPTAKFTLHYHPIYRSDYFSPTTDELLEELPYAININKGSFEYRVSYHIVARVDNVNFFNKSLPEALAQMWLWLKKEKLI